MATLLADASRARVLRVLMDGQFLTANQRGARAGLRTRRLAALIETAKSLGYSLVPSAAVG